MYACMHACMQIHTTIKLNIYNRTMALCMHEKNAHENVYTYIAKYTHTYIHTVTSIWPLSIGQKDTLMSPACTDTSHSCSFCEWNVVSLLDAVTGHALSHTQDVFYVFVNVYILGWIHAYVCEYFNAWDWILLYVRICKVRLCLCVDAFIYVLISAK